MGLSQNWIVSLGKHGCVATALSFICKLSSCLIGDNFVVKKTVSRTVRSDGSRTFSDCYCRRISALACMRNCRAAVKALLTFKSFELPSKTIGWIHAGQTIDKPWRIFEWCSLNALVHVPQTILILDICSSAQLQVFQFTIISSLLGHRAARAIKLNPDRERVDRS